MHPLIVQDLASERYQRLLDEASRARLQRAAGRPSASRIRLTAARMLISAGRRLAQQPPASPARRPLTVSCRS